MQLGHTLSQVPTVCLQSTVVVSHIVVAMGNCVGGAGAPENVFKVISINDDESLVQKGRMEVTSSELVYVDTKSREDWHWPLKYLRKYGCDGDVFTFEAGRKCPGGEGLYAFSTKKANILFDMVARNINQGELSPVPDPETETSVMNFPPHQTSTTSPTPGGVKDQPSYTNITPMGNPLPNGDIPDEASTPDPTKFLYREVVFDRPPEEHPKPSNPPQKTSSYTQIDFDRTAELSERKRGVEALPSLTSTPHGRTSSTSTAVGSGSGKHHGGRRNRMNTYAGRDRQGSRSESSFSSQSSLTESTRDIRSPPKHTSGSKATPQGGADGSNPSMYQNVQVGVATEQQYQNVQVGAGDVSQVFDSSTHQQPNYCNISLTASGNSSSLVPGPTENGLGPLIRVNGDSMMTYAQLELSSDRGRSSSKPRSMSSSGHAHRDTPQQQYTQLDFPVGDGSSSGSRGEEHHHRSHSHSHSRRTASAGSAPNSSSVNTSRSLVGENIPEEEPTPSSAGGVDETKVTYGVLNFSQMDALAQLQQEREREKEQEQQHRDERERANTKGKKSK